MKILAVLLFILAPSCKTRNPDNEVDLKDLDVKVLKQIESNGRQPVVVYGKTYTIKGNNDLLYEDDSPLKSFSGLDFPYVKKIFRYNAPSDGKDTFRLLVWFYKTQSGTMTGHSEGVYIYNPQNINSWDKFNDSKLYSNKNYVLSDVVLYKNQLLALRSKITSKRCDEGDDCEDGEGYLVRNEKSLIFYKGSLAQLALDFKPLKFLVENENLNIIGGKERSFNQYRVDRPSLPPVWVKTIGESNINVK